MLLFLPGKGEEQRAAASLACLLCIQLGSGIESEEVFKTLKPIFKTILADGSANIQARQAVSVSAALTDSALEVSLLNRSVPLTGGYQPGPLYSSRRRRYSGELVDLFTSLAWRELGFMMSPSLPLQDVQATMECFENLFTRSYARADGTCPTIPPQTSQLHTNALLSWALLLTICAASQLKDILRK